MSTLRSRYQRLLGKAVEEQPQHAAKSAEVNEDEHNQAETKKVEVNQSKVNEEVVEDENSHCEVCQDRQQLDNPLTSYNSIAVDQKDESITTHAHDELNNAGLHKQQAHNTSPYVRLIKQSPIAENEPHAEKWRDMLVQQAENEYGSFLLRTTYVRAEDAIGMHPFGDWQKAGSFLNAFHPEVNSEYTQFLFLDLETTGLGSGAGNVPFMVGLAFWDNGGITVQQALIRHPAEERAMLAYVHHLSAHFTHLVTYNGKSFDWPLMHSRFVMNGMRQKIWEPLHVDLLHPSRAIWRNTLESCKLSHIEKMRLGIIRLDDLPGSEAPTRYFQFLNSGDPDLLMDVFRHNEIDMLSLVTLAIRFGQLLGNLELNMVVQQPSDPEEMVRTGLWLEKMGNNEHSQQLFELAAYIPRQRTATLMLLAMRDKKKNNIERALYLWEKIVHYKNLLVTREQVEAAIELSMYYEHKTKDIETALHFAELALERINEMVSSNRRTTLQRNKEKEQLAKRIARLKKKSNKAV